MMQSGRVQVKLPSGAIGGIGSSLPKGPNYFIIVLLFLIPILVFGASLYFFWGGSESRTPYSLTIRRFSGTAEMYSRKTKQWTKITRQTKSPILLYAHDKVRTGPDSEFELKIPDVFDSRLKPSAELEVLPSKVGPEGKELKLRLQKGSLFSVFGKKIKDWKLYLETPLLVSTLNDAMCMLTAEEETESSIAVLEGAVQARAVNSKELVSVKALEIFTVTFGGEVAVKPTKVSYQQWRAISEVRELLGVASAKEVEQQIDLRKKAGSLFQYVLDEGTFYKPDWGFANREFYEEADKKVILRADFDVYPQYSYAGLYFKTRNFDLSKVKHLSFYLKAASEKKILERFRIEMKDRYATVRGYAVAPITEDWRLYSFDFNAQKATPVTEVVFIFENAKVGPLGTNGTVYIKDINIE
ncbi:MAG: hypothetical protein A3C35_00050 [Omnitrophica bacterium RIFCSPHIGHO2_02_FULL_46_11]|nr:MAG: hypothetical protein A3C35_00050 [Omnitrophica bacterium RIFCSPHIGHO2_02_FULL_46_11]